MMKQRVGGQGSFPPEGPVCMKVLRREHGASDKIRGVEGRDIGRIQVVKIWLRHPDSITGHLEVIEEL